MDLGLAGAVVLVTGGRKGIGLACARAFAAEGAKVAIASRSREDVDASVAAIAAEDVARVVLFLASPAAAYVSGAAVTVDGAVTAMPHQTPGRPPLP